MIRGLEDGLDKAARCASQRAIQGRGAERRADIQRAKRAGVGIDADCLGTRPDRGRMAASPGMLCYPRIRPWERSLRGWRALVPLSTYPLPYCLLRDLS